MGPFQLARAVVLLFVAASCAPAPAHGFADSDAAGRGDAAGDAAVALEPGADAGAPDAPALVVDARADSAVAAACPAGSTFIADRTTCGAPSTAPASLAMALAGAARGDVLTLGALDVATLPCAPVRVCVPDDAPTMLFSDDPESPTTDGVLYADVVGPGRYRAYVYHANGGATLRKFPLVALNEGATDAHLVVNAKGIAGPSQAYVAVGKDAIAGWLQAPVLRTLTIPPHTRVLLDADLDARHAAKNELVHAIVDFATDAPVKVSVVTVGAAADAAAVAASLPLLPSGAHVRGTFPQAERILVASGPLAGVGRLVLGNNVTENDLAGHDAVDGTGTTLHGNFGLVYRFHLDFAGKTGVVLAPRGGGWGGGARLPKDENAPAGVVQLPTLTEQVNPPMPPSAVGQAVVMGHFASGPAPEVLLVTAGGSSLPVDLVLVPAP